MLTASPALYISNGGLCLQAFLSWLGFEQTVDGDLDESSDEAFNLQRALSLSSWPTTQALGPQGTFNSSTACMDWVHAWTLGMYGKHGMHGLQATAT
jgi:hypothetical protein